MSDEVDPGSARAVEEPATAIDRLARELLGIRRREAGATVEFVYATTVFAVL
jgi:hypothetical protein